MRSESVIVVGAGIGGLCCAIDLAVSGYEVTVIERAAACGGKMRQISLGAGPVDAGPTVLTLPWVFQQLFDDAGATFSDALTLHPLNILARHFWSDDSRLDLFADPLRTAEAIGAFAGAAEAKGYLAFCRDSKSVFDSLKAPFLMDHKTGPTGLTRRLGWRQMGALFRLRPFETYWRALGDYFSDLRLRQLFGRYATYCGSSPFKAPATLMLVAHVEQAGVWRVEGGMQRLAQALETLARARGVTFRLGSEVRTITVKAGRAAGVMLADGESLEAQAVVANADPAALASGSLGLETARAAPERQRARSLSAMTWAAEASASAADLVHHSVSFCVDSRAEFSDIFVHDRLPRDPTVYICAQDRHDRAAPRFDRERFLILVNAPPTGDQRALPQEETARCESLVFERLERLGLDRLTLTQTAVRTTPQGFNSLFPMTGGSLYGPATHGWRAAFERPGARTSTPGLYLAGGGTHPGAGVPMAALSGRLAASLLIQDRTSPYPSRLGGMVGGMSTPKATTVSSPLS